MRHNPITDIRFFFTTHPMECPYLDDQVERRLVTELSGRDAIEMNDRLSLSGFRRSHTIAYAPVCDQCQACVSVRIVGREYKPSRTQRKISSRNDDLLVTECPPIATREQFELFKSYIDTRHGDGDMNLMDYFDYQSLIEDTPVRTNMVEFRDRDGRLLACCLTDRITGGLSAVYSFFIDGEERRSLGTFVILWLIERALTLGLEYVYLGYWVEGSRKMDYKRKFQPIEGYLQDGWKRLGD